MALWGIIAFEMTKDQITHVSDEELGAAIAEPQFAGAYALMKAEMERRSLQKMLAASESLRQATATMAADVERIANSSGKLEVLSSALIAETANVHRQVVVLTASSHNIEWLTKWLIWLTVALGLFTLAPLITLGNYARELAFAWYWSQKNRPRDPLGIAQDGAAPEVAL